MKMIRHLLIFFGIYGFSAFLAFEIQRPKRPKLISIKSQQTLFYFFLYLLMDCPTKMAARRASNFYFLYGYFTIESLVHYLYYKIFSSLEQGAELSD